MKPTSIPYARKARSASLLALGFLLIQLAFTSQAHADTSATFSVLHTFSTNEGSAPSGPLFQGGDGRLYGNATLGGANSMGTVYAVNSAGTLTVLHTFSGSDGAHPVGPLVADSSGTLYGVTEYGGSNDAGTVFSITTSGTFNVLHSFAAWANGGNADGMEPRGGLTRGGDGNFYGTTTRGGSNDAGTLFRMTPAGALTTLYSFYAFNSAQADGAMPTTALVAGSDGRFYGTTSVGGTHYAGSLAPGTLFALALDGTFSALHSFTFATDGSSPSGLAPANDGTFYGATGAGGSNGVGTLFKSTAQGDITTLYTFSAGSTSSSGLLTNSEGAYPVSGILAGSDGTLYGATAYGGSKGAGSLFTLSPDNTLTVLHQFSTVSSSGTNSDGSQAISTPMRASDGNIYGAAALGGSNGLGVIYKLTMPTLPTVTLTLSSTQISSGGSTSLNWSSTNADACNSSGGWTGTRSSSGSTSVSPTTTTTYTLNCRNISGTTMTSATLTVGASDGSGTGGSGDGVATGSTTGSTTGSGGGGGGAMPLWLLAWTPLAALRRRRRMQ